MNARLSGAANALRPLRVCMVTGEYPPLRGGVADYTALLVEALRARSHTVRVVTTGESSRTDREDIAAVPRWDRHAARSLAYQLQSMDADVVHLQYQTAAFGMSPVVNALPLILRRIGVRVPFVTTFHDLREPYLFPKAGKLRNLANHFLIGLSSGCIFTDPSDLVRAHPRRPHAWIPMGPTVLPCTTDDRSSARRALGIGEDETILGYFGFINASKGVDRLLLACERLMRAEVDFRLLFVGDSLGASDSTNTGTSAEVWALADRLGLTSLLVHTGSLEPKDLTRALRVPDLFVLPFVDGASLRRSSLLTCLAHGVPVVTSEVGPMPDLCSSALVSPFEQPQDFRLDQSVLSSPVGDDAALARTIFRALNDPEQRKRAMVEGVALASRLDWSLVAAATERAYAKAD